MRKVLIDCTQNIPCNPCVSACHQGAIQIAGGLTDTPAVLEENCNGCGGCIAACPGQACFVVDMDYGEGLASVDIPFEYTPLPTEGEEVTATNNDGETLCPARVLRVLLTEKNNKTAIVRLAVSPAFARQVRGIAAPASLL